ncbi:putative mitochondrial DNA-directed RNA polymerase [Leptomonas seymouri]|uniref:DNA-directed RNA polymerase n=1 Tax=Leptomonas seymouri TaxID=5684 RepID=A0A0N1PCV7_LEPSE|nr:putative mitochondrial DNA-directed RNA polymerase [Leptomonas seymouri]|eukprot:KPI86033.1 putative mitochondrial DNA-directed RNA polymerase [Leptomonas seymouri]
MGLKLPSSPLVNIQLHAQLASNLECLLPLTPPLVSRRALRPSPAMRRSILKKYARPALRSALHNDCADPSLLSAPALSHEKPLGSTYAASSSAASYPRATSHTLSLSSAAVRTINSACNLLPHGGACLLLAVRRQTASSTKAKAAAALKGPTRKGNADESADIAEGDSRDDVLPPPATPSSSATTAKAVKRPRASAKQASAKRATKQTADAVAVETPTDKLHDPAFDLVGTLQKAMKPVNLKPGIAAARAYKARMRLRAAQQGEAGEGKAVDPKHPWNNTAVDANDDEISFSDSATELFVLDEARHNMASVDVLAGHDHPGEDGTSTPAPPRPPSPAPSTANNAEKSASVYPEFENAADIDDTLMDDPFHVPSVDDDALSREGGASASASAVGLHGTLGAAASSHQISEAVLSAVDLLCDDLFHCKKEVLDSFARTRSVKIRSKAEMVLQLVEQAHKAAHGENEDLSLTRRVLGDVFDETVRTSGVRSAWTNKSLEASHVEMACEKHLNFQIMANSNKVFMVRNNLLESARVLRRLTRIFQEEQEHLSVVAVGGVFRNYRAEADELVRSMPVAELVSPFASFLVSYVRYGSSITVLTRENVNERLVQLELFQPTVQEMDDTTTLHRLMDMLDPAVRAIELSRAAQESGKVRFSYLSPHAVVAAARAFSEESHTRWNTSAAPDWVHDLARLFCNWETIVRTDLPRFEDVPRYFFDCVLAGVVDYYVLQRVYGEMTRSSDIPVWIRQSLKVALMEHLTSEENVESALEDLLFYVQAGSAESSSTIQGDFFAMVLSQMQGAFQDVQEERSALHDERVSVILNNVCETASHCTRSHGLFSLLVRITEDLRFHLRFQRVFKRLSGSDRKTIRTHTNINMDKTLAFFEAEYSITPISVKAVGFLVVQLLYLSLRGDGSKRPVLERITSVTGASVLDVVGLTETKAVSVRDLHIAFPPQLSYNSWLNESDTREKSVYSVLPSVAVKGTTNQAMIISQAPMMKALDAISRVPWRINKYMLHVQEAIVREGFGFGKIRPGFYPLHYYSMSDGSIRYPSDRRRRSGVDGTEDQPGNDDNSDDGEVFNIQQRRQMQIQQNADWKELSELRSSRIHYLQALRQARSILQFSHIYFPNSMDFRGRMYPLPGRLNHTGSDPFRGLLEYAEPKPLGSVGLYWLKVHLANKMGMSKLSFDERVHYVDEHMEDVVQSAESPLQGDRWWQEASEPLQCLMACKEVANAMKCSQGPEKFLSRLPVAVDGSYNGLQHYSAIGRDAFGAALVNLIPSERPADAYTGILKEMLKSIHADAARDHQVAQRCLGTGKGQDKDHIKRKTIKRPIMTQVYGVTAFGMSEQIFDELQKQNKSHGLWTHTDMKEMAAYLRDKVLESLGITFRETQNCRQWISEVVQLIWKVQPPELRNALCWTTPLGLVVRQPYKVRNECSLFTTSGYARIAGDAIAPASRKQLTAIAPNLIHSLDATHLAMTALEMQHQGLSMMAVHDSYWTYACDLPKLSQVLREQFVNLYSKYDPLWELKEQWEETYFMDLRRHGVKLPEPPKRGDLDLNLVLSSPYFFS